MKIIKINESLTAFYAGREQGAGEADLSAQNEPKDWVQFDLDLGVCAYAFHQQGRALLFDTLVQPELGQKIRAHLEEKLDVEDISIALSHWHLDHVGGCAAFADRPIMASPQTLQILSDSQPRIEAGELWGPPPLRPLVLPNITPGGRTPFPLNDLKLELIPFNIHTPGSLALYCGRDKILLAGDMLEDNIPCLNHPEEAHNYLRDLAALAGMDITAIYPGHGSPDKIAHGGYGKELIAAASDYIRHVLACCREESFPSSLKDWIGPWEERGALVYHPVYEGVHRANQARLREYYKDKRLPELAL